MVRVALWLRLMGLARGECPPQGFAGNWADQCDASENGDSVVISGVVFVNITAVGAFGSALEADGQRVELSSLGFVGCRGRLGGACYLHAVWSGSSAVRCFFVDCYASDEGGGLYRVAGGHFEMACVDFLWCASGFGGGLCSRSAGVALLRANFTRCQTTKLGEAIDGSTDASVALSLFVDSGRSGSPTIDWTSGSLNATDSAFVDNAGGAFYIYSVVIAARSCAFRNTPIGERPSGIPGSLVFSGCSFSGALPSADGLTDGGGNLQFQNITTAATIGCPTPTPPASARATGTPPPLLRGGHSNPYAGRRKVLRAGFHYIFSIPAVL